MKLTLGSLFDGSGGFPLAGMMFGIEPVWASEIEPFPIRVTTKRFPQMKHFGDVSQLSGGTLPPVDIITFGSPCTDLSVAGKRAGIEGSESSLFFDAIRIIKEMREETHGQYPRYAIWENVPGAFSSNEGRDFEEVLNQFVRILEPTATVPALTEDRWPYADIYMGDGWSLAYRVLDAQYFGVPQRRRRIFLVMDFNGSSAGEILFERAGVSRDFTPSESAWQRIAGSATGRIGATGFDGYNGELTGDVSSTLGVNCGMSTGRNGIVLNDQGGSVMDVSEGIVPTLRAETHGNLPIVMGNNQSDDTGSILIEQRARDARYKFSEEVSPTLEAAMGTGGNNMPFVMEQYAFGGFRESEVTMPITPGVSSKRLENIRVNEGRSVRRLTPTECARLQGFPDWWCDELGEDEPDIEFWQKVFDDYGRIMGQANRKTERQIRRWLKNPHTDTAEYKMWGNGVALPVVAYIMKGIVETQTRLSANNA